MIEGTESILQEAHRLTHGPRNQDYGHPLDDYTRTAALVSALLAHKLKEPISPAEMALAMCCVKMSRHIHAPKRDNVVDLAGYAWVSWACTEETQRRSQTVNAAIDEACELPMTATEVRERQERGPCTPGNCAYPFHWSADAVDHPFKLSEN